MFIHIKRLLEEIEADPTASALLITGEGRAFCAGGRI